MKELPNPPVPIAPIPTMENHNCCKWTKERYSETENYFECWTYKPTCKQGNGIEHDRPIEQEKIEFAFCPYCGKPIKHLAETLD